MNSIEVNELLFEATLNITGLTEYGVSFEELMSGKITLPPEGARFDVAFEGTAIGEKIKGREKGVDYLWIRANGRTDLDIHAEITTDDGQKISLKANGVSLARKESSIHDLRINAALFSSSKDYTWLNILQVWGIGTIDMATQIMKVTYSV